MNATENRDALSFGIFLSGPQAQKSAIVILQYLSSENKLKLSSIYDKIGPSSQRDTIERIVRILRLHKCHEGFVNVPLSVPACLRCTRLECPGVVQCDDIAVAYLTKINEQIKASRIPKKRKKVLHPQQTRLWDAVEAMHGSPEKASFHSSNFMLATHGSSLLKRLRKEQVRLYETAVLHSLMMINEIFQLGVEDCMLYHRFQVGKQVRRNFIEKISLKPWFEVNLLENEQLFQRRNVFEAFICALVSQIFMKGGCTENLLKKIPNEGWVYLPDNSIKKPFFC